MNRIFIVFISLLISTLSVSTSSAQCEIWDLEATPSDCDGGSFWVTLNFNFAEIGAEGFTVQGNGTNYGNFDYADLPIQIGPLAGDGTTEYEFIAIDNQFDDCQNWTGIDPILCSVGDCEVFDLELLTSECDGDYNYDLTINFEFIEPGNDFFDVVYDGETIGFYALADLPITIENFEDNGEFSPFITVCINDSPDCCVSNEFLNPNCGPGGDCEIWDLEAINLECEDDEFWIVLGFEFENIGTDGFSVNGNGNNYGSFPYDDLPITLGPLPADGTSYEFIVSDVDHPDCSDFIELGVVDCGGGGDCDIWDLIFETGDCNSDGHYNLWIDFNYENVDNDFFEVIYEGDNIGTYSLADLPILIENFEDNGEFSPVITVCINDSPDCCETNEFQAPDCEGDCEIWDIYAEAHECDDLGQFMVDIEFNSNNTGPEGFSIVANGEEFGPFEYGDTFYTFGPLEGGVVYEILIVDNEFSDCGDFYQFGPIYCDDDCHIYDLTASVSDCDDLGQFYVTLDFEFSGTGNDGFKVVGNGNTYGFFGYDELPVTLGPFQTPIDDLEFIVSDVQNPDCGDFVGAEAPECDGGGDCEIWDLTADITPCQDDGTFYIVLDFEYSNTSDIAFTVHGNGIDYGIFTYAQLPISIGPLIGNGTTPYEFVVQDLLFPDCGAEIEVGPVDCGITGDCSIFDFIADASDCNDDGTYDLWLNFDYEFATNIYFDVIYQGDIIGYFPLANLPIVIPHFHDDGEMIQEITVCINDSPDCCATTSYEAPDCMNPMIWPGDTESNNAADHFDLLNIGLAFGAEGPERVVQGIEWTELDADAWTQQFVNGLNYAHADCNGDGTVDADDIEAIQLNYGETHGDPVPQILIGGSEDDPVFYVDLENAGAIVDGQQFSASIILGTEALQVENLYGVAFTLTYDPEMIDPSSIELKYDPSWLGVEGVNLITFDRAAADDGKMNVTLVRTDQNDVSGHGHIAEFIGIIDNIAGKEEVRIGIVDVKAIQENEVLIPLVKPTQVVGLATSTFEPIQGVFKVFPNPAQSEIQLHHPDGLEIVSVAVKDVNGKSLRLDLSGNNSLNVSELASGVYFLEIETERGFFLEKLVKMN